MVGLAFALVLAAQADTSGVATIRTQDYVPQPFESRSYPTLALSSSFASALAPGYRRMRVTWPARIVESVSYSKYRTPQYQSTMLCVVPSGSATRDEPLTPAIDVLLCLGGLPCDANRCAIWAVHRGAVADWTNYIGAAMYAPGQPRTLTLYPAHGETINVRRTE